MRPVLALLAAIGLLATTFPATAAAARPIRDGDSQSGILCELSTEAGFVSLFVEATDGGSFADLAVWRPGSVPFEDLPDIVTSNGRATFDGSRLTADFELVSVDEPTNPEDPPIFDPAGQATVEAILTPSGDPMDFDSRDVRDGNRLIRRGLSIQLLAVDGIFTIDLLDGTTDAVSLAGCGASTTTQTLFVTNPNAYVISFDQLFIECRWATERGSVELRAIVDDGAPFSELIIVDGDGILVGLTSPEFSDSAYVASYELFDPMTGEVRGAASADASLAASGERVNDHQWVDGIRFSLVGDRLTAEGTLTFETERGTTTLALDDSACEATDLRVSVIERIGEG